MDEILKVSDLYATGLEHVQARRKQWLDIYKDVREHMKEIANYLNENSKYKQNFFVDTNRAFNEEINGSCAEVPSLTFRSGAMEQFLTFRNSLGERKEYLEEGFQITLSPTVTGMLVVMLWPHYSEMSEEKPQYVTIAMVENPEALKPELIDKLIAKGMELAFYSSYTGMVELQDKEMSQSQMKYQHAPIGFKRYETTEKA